MALGWFVLFGVIGVTGGYCRPYGLWYITRNRIRFSRRKAYVLIQAPVVYIKYSHHHYQATRTETTL